jgi:hypothetical protein
MGLLNLPLQRIVRQSDSESKGALVSSLVWVKMDSNELIVHNGLSICGAIASACLWMISPAEAQFNPTQMAQAPFRTLFENATLSPGFSPDPTVVRGISGGPETAASIAGRTETATGPCTGYVDTEPDHRLELTSFFNYLSLQVQSAEDTTLVIRGPGGSWCNDDYQGKSPGIAGQWLSGTYEIWVGSYNPNGYYPYVIQISTTRPEP